LSARLNSQDLSISKSPVIAEQLGGLVARIADNSISGKMAKQVFEGMWAGEGSADEVIEARGLKQVSDSGALEQMVTDVLTANQGMVDDYIKSDEAKRKKKLGGFMGKIMQASKGQANPQQVNQILAQKLSELV
jgi:aspartyl-tRNA(Asn)/glutamyl-tRNA(Gln) amidotransferase subunit B